MQLAEIVSDVLGIRDKYCRAQVTCHEDTTSHSGLHLHFDVGTQILDVLAIRDKCCTGIRHCDGDATDDSGQVDGETDEQTKPTDCHQNMQKSICMPAPMTCSLLRCRPGSSQDGHGATPGGGRGEEAAGGGRKQEPLECGEAPSGVHEARETTISV